MKWFGQRPGALNALARDFDVLDDDTVATASVDDGRLRTRSRVVLGRRAAGLRGARGRDRGARWSSSSTAAERWSRSGRCRRRRAARRSRRCASDSRPGAARARRGARRPGGGAGRRRPRPSRRRFPPCCAATATRPCCSCPPSTRARPRSRSTARPTTGTRGPGTCAIASTRGAAADGDGRRRARRVRGAAAVGAVQRRAAAGRVRGGRRRRARAGDVRRRAVRAARVGRRRRAGGRGSSPPARSWRSTGRGRWSSSGRSRTTGATSRRRRPTSRRGSSSTAPDDSEWAPVHATFGPRASVLRDGTWRAAEWSPSRGIFKDPVHVDYLGGSGRVPEEFLHFGPAAAGDVVPRAGGDRAPGRRGHPPRRRRLRRQARVARRPRGRALRPRVPRVRPGVARGAARPCSSWS